MNSMLKKTAFALAAFILLISCQSKEEKSKAVWPSGVKYEVFVLSFADGDGDGKGDFKGLTSKLDYLQDLGINGIWMMPIMPSPTYHKYDVTDYKGVNPEYGTVDEFKTFVNEAHKRDIKIIVDLILNHTGSDHPWFQSALKSKDSPYRNYYVWANKDSIRQHIAKKQTTFDSDNITQWHAPNGDTLAEHYYGFFWGGMPDLNFDNPKVRDEFREIGRYWLQDMNVDGFRLDAAKHVYPDDRAKDNHAFWIEFRKDMEKIKPDVYLVGEVWSDSKTVAPYLKGLPALFNFDMGYAIANVVNAGKDSLGLVKKYKEISDFYKSVTNEYLDATFLRNHDQARILSELGDDQHKARLAASILLTLPGTPYIYYGEEIGMIGKKPDEYCREPFIWDVDKKDPMQTHWEIPRFSTDLTVVPYSKQKDDQNSMYNFYKSFIHYRNSSKALTYGDIENSGIDKIEVVSFIRKQNDDEVLVIHNVSSSEISLPLKEVNTKFDAIDYTTTGAAKLRDGEIVIPAYSTVILK
jgi:alpha-amylase